MSRNTIREIGDNVLVYDDGKDMDQVDKRDGPMFLHRTERMLSDKGTLHAATWTSGTVLQ